MKAHRLSFRTILSLRFKTCWLGLVQLTFICLVIGGCASTPEKESAKRQGEAEDSQQKYSSYTTPQLQLKRQEIAASIPSWYFGTGLAGAIQTRKIESRQKEIARIDRELLRRAESGDRAGQREFSVNVVSDPLGARIEADGRFLGIAPTIIHFSGDLGVTATIRATPAALDRPMLGYLQGSKRTADNASLDPAFVAIVGFVIPNSPASRMGLLSGDKVVGINGFPLPEVSGSKESADAFRAAYLQQLSQTGFGGEVTVKIIRNGKEQELRGRTSEQVEGVFYVQERAIHPMLFDNQVLIFDMKVQTGSRIVLGGGGEQAPSRKAAISTGTGFVVAEGGYVLTCQHVVGKSENIEIRDGKGTKHKATVVASDAGNDLCLLKADDLDAKPIPSAPPNSVSAGETIYSLGFPMEGVLENQSPVAGNGVVASLRGLRGDPRHLQVTVPVNPGNSGGPILDAYGRWVAVASHKLSDFYGLATTGQAPQGINFAVKGSLVVPLFDSIPEVKLPVSDSKERIALEEAAQRLSKSIVFITARN